MASPFQVALCLANSRPLLLPPMDIYATPRVRCRDDQLAMKLISLWKRVSMESKDTTSPGTCDACGTQRGPFIKVSLGKDFFGRPYDRLSPSSDQSPKWFCEGCSQQKNFQRDFRDIQSEVSKWQAGQTSELAHADQVSRSQARLREIQASLEGSGGTSPFLDSTAVMNLLHDLDTGLAKSPSNNEFQKI